jgi:hypothetical protein
VLCDFGVQKEAQHHAPVFSKATRARRTGFYRGDGAPNASRLRPFASPHPEHLRALLDLPAILAHRIPGDMGIRSPTVLGRPGRGDGAPTNYFASMGFSEAT